MDANFVRSQKKNQFDEADKDNLFMHSGFKVVHGPFTLLSMGSAWGGKVKEPQQQRM